MATQVTVANWRVSASMSERSTPAKKTTGAVRPGSCFMLAAIRRGSPLGPSSAL
ncbi:hypothetical protein D3C72_1714670 [compost metagenome]